MLAKMLTLCYYCVMDFLKGKSKFFTSFCFFCFFTLSLFSQDNIENIRDLRNLAMHNYRTEISNASFHEIPVENLGVWHDILETSLFMLIRKTEIYRGRMRIVIEDSSNAKCKIYPDGTILISSAIFDYIDTKLANTQNMSPRKIKNFNSEREKMLSAFLVHEVAAFIQEDRLLAFSKSHKSSLEEIKFKNLEADKLAMLILKVACYDSNIFYDHLEELKRIQYESENFKRFYSYFDNYYDPQTRISYLLKNLTEAEVMAEDVSSIIESLEGDSLEALNASREKLISLQNEFPNNMYFKRLFAITMHKKWALNNENSNEDLLSAYPASMPFDNVIYKYFKILNSSYEDLEIKQIEFSKDKKESLENISSYDEAVRAYKNYLNSIEETGMLSSYAVLLHYSNKTKEKMSSINMAEKAYLQENGTESLTSALNYSSILYMTGKDYTKSKKILEDILFAKKIAAAYNLFLKTGINIDERALLFNYARILFGLGEVKKAEVIKKKLELLLFSLDDYKKIVLKKIFLGSTTDDLIEYWGKPALIQYNYFLEKWHYNFLNVDISIVPKEGNLIQKIAIHSNSSLTLPGDLRVGESKKYFEKVFGRSLYYTGDFKNYFYKGNKIQVFFVNDYAREIIITRLYNDK